MDQPNQNRFIEMLAHVRHFASLPFAVKEALAEEAHLHCFPTGQIIYMEGEPAHAVFIIESGWVKSTHISLEGREQALLFLQPGEVFGDIAVFNGVPYPCTVTALEPVQAWTIEREAILRLANRHPELALAVTRRMGDRVIYYVSLVEDLSLRSVEARLAATLLKHAQRDGDRLFIPRRHWTTFDEMAVRLGTVRDVLARALHTLEQENLLRVEKTAIVILDPDGLRQRGKS